MHVMIRIGVRQLHAPAPRPPDLCAELFFQMPRIDSRAEQLTNHDGRLVKPAVQSDQRRHFTRMQKLAFPQQIFKCMPTSSLGAVTNRSTAYSDAAIFAINDALVTKPKRCAIRIPSVIPRLIPNSSAFTISCLLFIFVSPPAFPTIFAAVLALDDQWDFSSRPYEKGSFAISAVTRIDGPRSCSSLVRIRIISSGPLPLPATARTTTRSGRS